MKLRFVQCLGVIPALALLFPLIALAADKTERSVDIPAGVQVGDTQMTPGHYEVEWQGTGPAVQVSFKQQGKTVATVHGLLKTNDDQVTQDDIVTNATGANTRVLQEIDFRHQKEALVFGQNQGGM